VCCGFCEFDIIEFCEHVNRFIGSSMVERTLFTKVLLGKQRHKWYFYKNFRVKIFSNSVLPMQVCLGLRCTVISAMQHSV
jgi:hypothetical protein